VNAEDAATAFESDILMSRTSPVTQSPHPFFLNFQHLPVSTFVAQKMNSGASGRSFSSVPLKSRRSYSSTSRSVAE
jgi:hypothetical protein